MCLNEKDKVLFLSKEIFGHFYEKKPLANVLNFLNYSFSKIYETSNIYIFRKFDIDYMSEGALVSFSPFFLILSNKIYEISLPRVTEILEVITVDLKLLFLMKISNRLNRFNLVSRS